MRIKQALKFALLDGKDSTKIRKRIADRIWGDSKPKTKEVNTSSLVSGKTMKYDPVVIAICEETGVSPNFLFGYDSETKTFNNEKNL